MIKKVKKPNQNITLLPMTQFKIVVITTRQPFETMLNCFFFKTGSADLNFVKWVNRG